MRRLTVLASALILSACALSPASRLKDDAPWLALPPQALDTTLALQQRLTFSHAHGEQSVDALLECDPDELRLVLHSLGQPLLRLRWDGQHLESWVAAQVPVQLRAEQVLSDLQLVYWPSTRIAAALPSGWTLQTDGANRSLRQHAEEVVRIRHEHEQILIDHPRAGYRLRIQSVAMPP